MKILRALGVGAALCCVLAGQGTPPAKTAFDKKTMEDYVRNLFLWPPQVAVAVSDPKPTELAGLVEISVVASAGTVSQEERFLVTKDGQKIVRGTVFSIKDSPFQTELNTLKNDLQPSMGTPGAPVVIALFSDFQCSYCREAAKALRENLLKEFPTQVRLYFRDYPLDQIHPWARTAAIGGRCIFRAKPAMFWEYHDWIFDTQPEINLDNVKAKIKDFAQNKGLDAVQIAACVESRATETEINQSVAEGKLLKIDSTPTMFVNGRKIPGTMPWASLKRVIEWEVDQTKRTGAGGEKCCEVKLPSPLNP